MELPSIQNSPPPTSNEEELGSYVKGTSVDVDIYVQAAGIGSGSVSWSIDYITGYAENYDHDPGPVPEAFRQEDIEIP
jgi:hypothetical protein